MSRLHLTLFFDLRIPMMHLLALNFWNCCVGNSWNMSSAEALGFGQVLGGSLWRMILKSWPQFPWFDRRPAMFGLPTCIASFGEITGNLTFFGRCYWIQMSRLVICFRIYLHFVWHVAMSVNRLHKLSDGATMADGT